MSDNFIEVPEQLKINLLYTNDLKGEAEQMSYLSTVIKEIRAEKEHTILLDSGNWAKGTFLSDKFKGLPMAEILPAIGYDAVGIGEGEIIFGSKNLYLLYEQANEKKPCHFLSCNLIEDGTSASPYFVKKYIFIEKGPFKIAVVGVSPTGSYPQSGLSVKDPYSVLPDVLHEISEQSPDVIVALSRLGFERDKALARAFPALSVIIGGVDCRMMETPEKVGNTFITQAGEKAKFVGSLELEMEATLRISKAEK